MELLKERIRKEGKVLPGGIIKIDGFLNHKVDTQLLAAMAEEFEKHFDLSQATVVLTAEASGTQFIKSLEREQKRSPFVP